MEENIGIKIEQTFFIRTNNKFLKFFRDKKYIQPHNLYEENMSCLRIKFRVILFVQLCTLYIVLILVIDNFDHMTFKFEYEISLSSLKV